MAKEPELLDAERYRERWRLAAGAEIRGQILARLINRDNSWPALLKNLPHTDQDHQLDDLRGISFDDVDLSGADLSFADLSYASFRSAKLDSIILQGSLLNWTDFRDSNLSEADLLQVSAQCARFDGANLSNAMMMKGSFVEGSFHSANLTSAVLDHADFSRADLTDSNLNHAERRKTNFDNAFISQSTLGVGEPLTTTGEVTSPHALALFESQYLDTFISCALESKAAAEKTIHLWSKKTQWRGLLDDAFILFVLAWKPEISKQSENLYRQAALSVLRSLEHNDVKHTKSMLEYRPYVMCHYEVLSERSMEVSFEWPSKVSGLRNDARQLSALLDKMGWDSADEDERSKEDLFKRLAKLKMTTLSENGSKRHIEN